MFLVRVKSLTHGYAYDGASYTVYDFHCGMLQLSPLFSSNKLDCTVRWLIIFSPAK